ncbi:unnamed protein product [Acanthoscelides obtectus]|uniref:Uncharacterized protein n=1 Tax=Acanthoscelides obtectus TaxID=200917 RepID=A0A9P0KH30_ACAOB|nr:unnamed protein product [Acanthoscelides obtectus]CAK1674859.1 hypothetical protein AOBTE_LOCUS29779 [Acanthoscelides obtectus]
MRRRCLAVIKNKVLASLYTTIALYIMFLYFCLLYFLIIIVSIVLLKRKIYFHVGTFH